jgi:hypothetical protein
MKQFLAGKNITLALHPDFMRRFQKRESWGVAHMYQLKKAKLWIGYQLNLERSLRIQKGDLPDFVHVATCPNCN